MHRTETKWNRYTRRHPRDKDKHIHRVPLLTIAILKMEYLAPPEKVVNNECRLTSKADIDAIAKEEQSNAIAAESILAQSRDIVLSLGSKVAEDSRRKFFGRIDVSVARVVCKKQKQSSV